jgi:gas vesicle protein
MTNSEKLLYLIAGTGIGATLGVLFAPSSGKEVRDNLTTQAHRGVDLITAKVEEGRKYLDEKGVNAGTVRNFVDRSKQALNESIGNVKERINESIEAGTQEYQAQRNAEDRGVI